MPTMSKMITISSEATSAGESADVEKGLAESSPAAAIITKADPAPNPAEKTHSNNKWIFIALIVFIGAAASSAFLSLGIAGAKNDSDKQFKQRATELSFAIESAAHDYQLFGLWIHESCHKSFNATEVPLEEDSAAHLGFCSRDEFRRLHEYIVSAGVDVQAIEYVPNITGVARAVVEAEAKRYYQENYPHYNYPGFQRVVPDAEPGQRIKQEKEYDFYLTLHYVEPVITNEAAIDLSIYSNPARAKAIDNAVTTWKPALSDRLKLVQETDPNAYGFGLIHPGVPNSIVTGPAPNGFSQIIVRIPALLERAARVSLVSTSVYIFDTTDTSIEPIFLGGADVVVDRGNVSLNSIPETRLIDTSSYFTRVFQVADRNWTVSVVPVESSLDLVYIILGGSIIFVACIVAAIWFHAHLGRVAKMNALRSEAEQEKSKVAEKQALLERELNEFIAHEVRNPLASAIAALTFVSAAAREPLEDEKSRKALLDDIHVAEGSLQFINELLRNMLDIHRATGNHIKLDFSPTDVLRDVFEPVASILFMRGAKVDIVTDCPKNLIVLSDRMRLKQIILNLAANATKFVEQGFIRLRAEVIDGSVTLLVEDSGPGIPPEKRERLFAKFQESLDLLNQGTGIGLCVCKNLSDLMGADIWLDNDFESGVEGCPGTRFTLRLNQAPVEVEPDALLYSNHGSDEYHMVPRSGSRTDGASPPLKLPDSMSVLFVDDDMVIRKMFIRALRRIGPNWEINEASNGETALRLAGSQNFDLVFVDQYMASVEKQLLGTETVRALRARGVTSTICGISANDKEQEFVNAGANAFMSKPFPCGKDELRTEILRVLEKARGDDLEHEREHEHEHESSLSS
jgi:signal transduction histidine kinase/CheY-like chemotaxis protein